MFSLFIMVEYYIDAPIEEDQDVGFVIRQAEKPLHTIDDDDDGSKQHWTTLRPLSQVQML